MPPAAIALVLLVLLGGCEARDEPAAEPPPGGWTAFGLQVRDLPASARTALGLSHGVMVTRVRAPANRTRILPGDVIVSVDQQEVRSAEEFGRLASAPRRGALGVIVRRNDADLFIALPRFEAPSGPQAPRDTPLRT